MPVCRYVSHQGTGNFYPDTEGFKTHIPGVHVCGGNEGFVDNSGFVLTSCLDEPVAVCVALYPSARTGPDCCTLQQVQDLTYFECRKNFLKRPCWLFRSAYASVLLVASTVECQSMGSRSTHTVTCNRLAQSDSMTERLLPSFPLKFLLFF